MVTCIRSKIGNYPVTGSYRYIENPSERIHPHLISISNNHELKFFQLFHIAYQFEVINLEMIELVFPFESQSKMQLDLLFKFNHSDILLADSKLTPNIGLG